MTVTIDWEADLPDKEAYEALVRRVVEGAVDYEECPYECDVSVLFTDDAGIHEMNRENRGIDAATDVLSFPMIEWDAPADYDRLEEDYDCFHPDTGELLLGDIVISTEHAAAQAKAYGHSLQREVAFLVAHSCLHLLGYDHMEDGERQDMERRQEGILQALGITRDPA